MTEEEIKYTSKKEMVRDGWWTAGLCAVGTVGSLWLYSINFIDTPWPLAKASDPTIGQTLEGIVGYTSFFLGIPYGVTLAQAGYLADSTIEPKEKDVEKAQWLIGGADISAGAVATGAIGAIAAAANHDYGAAGLWMGSIPMTAWVTNFFWNKAKNILRR